MTQIKTIVQTIHFVLSKIGKANKLKIVKLLYLADKYHLQLFGRTITGDNFIAMKRGPVGSVTKDVLDFNIDWLDVDQFTYVDECLERVSDFDYIAKGSNLKYEMLSETDRTALNFIIENFGKYGHGPLIELTHQFPEWKKHENDLLSAKVRSVNIPMDEMFSQIPTDPFKVPTDIVKESKTLFSGKLC